MTEKQMVDYIRSSMEGLYAEIDERISPLRRQLDALRTVLIQRGVMTPAEIDQMIHKLEAKDVEDDNAFLKRTAALKQAAFEKFLDESMGSGT